MAYRVMIVDDEKYICKFIQNRTNWEQLHVELAGDARNGKAALEMMDKEKPDIVLTDIRMPKMSGLEFIEEAQRRYPETTFIVMSAYSDFSYAQQAVRLGVEDYLLKPVDLGELERLLEKILRKKREELLEKLIRDERNRDASVFYGRSMAAVAFCIEEEEQGMQIEESLRKILEGIPCQVDLYCPHVMWSEGCTVFLLNGNQLEVLSMREIVGEVWEQNPELKKIAAVSEIVKPIHAFDAVNHSLENMKRRIFCPEENLIFDGSVQPSDSSSSQLEMQSELLYACKEILGREYGSGIKQLRHMVEKYVCAESSVKLIERFIEGVLHFLKNLQGLKIDRTDFMILSHRLEGQNCLLRYPSVEELKKDLLSLIERVFEGENIQAENEIIGQIKEFVLSNYKQDLSVPKIAGIFYLNANYLSTLFKENTGITLKSYMNGVRMEKAKEYLAQGLRSVTEVAHETGYSDSNYFSKVFKKYTGITPKQFRDIGIKI